MIRKLLVGMVCIVLSASASAAAPMVKTQAPGFYRMMLGDFEITALNDGVVSMPQVFPGVSTDEIHARLAERYLSDPVGMSFNAFLINTGNTLVLVDTGSGELADSLGWHGAGHLLDNLRAAGYRPEQIDEIYVTHAHPDHVGGLMLGGQRAFAHAIVRAARSEVEIYTDPQKMAAVLADAADKEGATLRMQRIRNLFQPYIEAGMFRSFDEDGALAAGVRALATPGHTRGHTCYVVESRGQTLIVIGDLIHNAEVQFPHPWAAAASDFDPKAAISHRNQVFELAAKEGDWIAGAHLSFPGLGHIRGGRGTYLWIPANYEIPKS